MQWQQKYPLCADAETSTAQEQPQHRAGLGRPEIAGRTWAAHDVLQPCNGVGASILPVEQACPLSPTRVSIQQLWNPSASLAVLTARMTRAPLIICGKVPGSSRTGGNSKRGPFAARLGFAQRPHGNARYADRTPQSLRLPFGPASTWRGRFGRSLATLDAHCSDLHNPAHC